jgi:hypothetical protein
MRERRSYAVNLVVNGRPISEVVIDTHYEIKHPDIDDGLILDLVRGLGGKEFQPEEREGEWEFFMLDRTNTKEKSTGSSGACGTRRRSWA